MQLKEISKDIYDVSALLDEVLWERKGLPNVKRAAKRHGKSIMPRSYWMPVKTQDLRRQNLPSV